MRRTHAVAAVIIALVAFAYGFGAGTFRFFPYSQVKLARDRLQRVSERDRTVPIPQTVYATAIVESELQRLLFKRIQLPDSGEDFVAGGALATSGPLVFVFNRDGGLYVFDLHERRRLSTRVSPVPINRNDLLASTAQYEITVPWFRVAGAYVHRESDSSFVLLAYHNRFDPSRRCFTANISRADIVQVADSIVERGSWKTIFTTSPCMTLQRTEGNGRHAWAGHISGGKIIDFASDEVLVSIGDYNFDGYLREAWSMNPANLHGKYVRLNVRTGATSVFAIGARNSMGLHRDYEGTIWSTESGPQGGDELNIVREGANFGWPVVTLGLNYETSTWPSNPAQGRHDAFDPPVFAWLPSIVPTNLVRVDSTAGRFPLWHGDLVLATLRDESLHRLRIGTDGRVIYSERIPVGERIRDLTALDDGRIVFLTDATGFLVIVDDADGVFEPMSARATAWMEELERLDALQDIDAQSRRGARSGESVFAQRCASCHSLETDHRTGPHLLGLFSRGVGAAEGYRYSYEMGASTAGWTEELLRDYLANPNLVFQGTRMQRLTLSQVELDSLVVYLRNERRTR